MEIEVLPVGGVGRGYALRGEFDLECIPEVERLFFNGDTSIPVILEASQLTFMDSTGLWILLRLARAGDGTTPGVVIRNPSEAVRRLINLAIPDGVDGLEIDFPGSGPGAAHRFTELSRSTRALHLAAQTNLDEARRLRRARLA
jgi:anti-anti-sigma factor